MGNWNSIHNLFFHLNIILVQAIEKSSTMRKGIGYIILAVVCLGLLVVMFSILCNIWGFGKTLCGIGIFIAVIFLMKFVDDLIEE